MRLARVLLDAVGAIVTVAGVQQLYAYDAYGNAVRFDPSQAATSLLYNGEQFDKRIQQQYFRARYYEATTGRFTGLDSFAGNLQDPLSLHKYLFVGGNPVSFVDPTGRFTTTEVLVSLSVGTLLTVMAADTILGAVRKAAGLPGVVTQPSLGETLTPVYGMLRSSSYNFQEGNYFLSAVYAGLAVSDLYAVNAMAQFLGKSLFGAAARAAVPASEVIFTKVAAKDIGAIASSALYVSKTEGVVYGTVTQSTGFLGMLRSMTLTSGGSIEWTGQAATLFGRHEIQGWFSGLKWLLGQQRTTAVGNVRLLGYTQEAAGKIVVWSAKIESKGGGAQVRAQLRQLGRLVGIDYGASRIAHGLAESPVGAFAESFNNSVLDQIEAFQSWLSDGNGDDADED